MSGERPAHAAALDPIFRLAEPSSVPGVCASYSADLAAKHARDCRNVLESAWYKQLFPRTRIDPRKNTESEFETTARGYRMGTSVGGTLTGRGGNLIVIDDPMKPADAMSDVKRAAVAAWYDSTLSSRLDRKTEDAIILVMQRLHVDDLVGHVLGKDGRWTHLDLPAIADADENVPIGDREVFHRKAGELLHPEREPLEVLHELKAAMGSQAFSAQYLQRPIPAGGALLKEKWIRTYARRPAGRTDADRVVQSWDTATQTGPTNDFSVCTTWLIRGADYYLLDVLRRRLEFPELRRRVLSHAAAYQASAALIEDASTGAPLIQDLRREGRLRPIAIRPERDKLVRLEAQSAVVEAGHVLLPATAPWLDDYRDELLAFPHGRHDDQVDSTSQFLAWAERNRRTFGREPRAYVLSRGKLRVVGGG